MGIDFWGNDLATKDNIVQKTDQMNVSSSADELINVSISEAPRLVQEQYSWKDGLDELFVPHMINLGQHSTWVWLQVPLIYNSTS